MWRAWRLAAAAMRRLSYQARGRAGVARNRGDRVEHRYGEREHGNHPICCHQVQFSPRGPGRSPVRLPGGTVTESLRHRAYREVVAGVCPRAVGELALRATDDDDRGGGPVA